MYNIVKKRREKKVYLIIKMKVHITEHMNSVNCKETG